MALTYDQITATTNKLIDKKMTDGVFKSNGLYARLWEKKRVRDGGEKLTFAITHVDDTETTGGWYAGSENLDGSEYDPITAASFDWKNIFEHVTIAKDKLRKASGDANKIALLAERVALAEKAMRHRLGKGLHNDGVTDTKAPVGLGLVCDTTSAAYGGISTTDFAEWTPVVDSNASVNRALTLAMIQSQQGSQTEGPDKPTCAVLRQGGLNSLWALLQPHQRLIYDKGMSGLGHEGVINFNAIPYLVDSKAAANTITYINEDYFFLVLHKDAIMKRETFSSLEDSDSFRSRVISMLALCCNNRRFQGRLEDVIES